MCVSDLKLGIFSLLLLITNYVSVSEYLSIQKSVITNYELRITNYELRITNYLKMSLAGIALL
jgi:hypothetical protein